VKTRILKPLFILFFIISTIFIGLIASSGSMEKNEVWLGLSLPRLVMIVFILGSMLAVAILWAAMVKQSGRVSGAVEFWSSGQCVFYLVVAMALLAVFEVLLMLLGAVKEQLFLGIVTVVLQRGFLFILWAFLITVLACVALGWDRRDMVRSKSAWMVACQATLERLQQIPVLWWLAPFFFLLVVGVLLAYSPDFSGRMPKHDSGIFLYFGSRILKGDIPFRNLWDHKPPLIFYIDALGLWLSNGSIWGVWGLEVGSLFLSTMMLFAILRKRVPMPAVFLALLGFVVNVAFPMEGGNFTEEFGIPLQCLALLLFVKALDVPGKKKPWAWFLIGTSLGMAVMLKQTLIGIWGAMAMVALYRWIKKEGVQFGGFIWWALGLGLTVLGWVYYFYLHNALWDFWDVAYRFNFLYSDIAPEDRIEAVGIIFWVFLTASWFYYFGLATWAAFIGRGWAYLKKLPLLLVVALIDFPLEIILISLSGKNYNHYFFTMILCFAILVAYGWAYGRSWIKKPWIHILVYLLAAVMIVYKPVHLIVDAYRQPPEAAVRQVVDYIKRNTDKDDTVILWGSQTVINFMSGRDTPTRFVHQKPLFREGYAERALSMELLNDLKSKKPKLIINSYLPSTPFIEMNAKGECLMPSPLPDGMFEVFDYICKNYSLSQEIGKDKWKIYYLHQ
jgi:hypothetical protein